MTGFENVVPALGQALSKRGYTELTPVQEAVLAAGLGDSDLLVSAQTGSGKTVAFGLAIAPTLLDGADRFAHATAPLALAVAPTRELALQVKRELEWLYAMTGAQVASCVGGMDMREERRVLQRGANIVVGTPGRLRDHIERGSFDTTGLKALVLDEADEMLDLGFRDDLEFILDAAPSGRRTLMFSATVPSSIANLARRYQRNAVRVSTTAEKAQHVDIEYRALSVAPNDRENAIVNVLRYFEAKNALVFCATRAAVNRMTSRFNNRGFSVVALSGELSQNERTHALQAMRDGRARVCIATDVAARGLDLPNLELVIHADIPKTRETLLHRSGRTGRAGRKGVCALIVTHNERRRTERLLNSANVTAAWARPPSVDDIVQRDRERILEDTTLTEPLNADEKVFAEALLARHGSEQVAAAFLRLHSAGRSAPEELLDTAPPERKKKRRDDFKGGAWFSLSVGHKQNAEARWLLPMLCRAGHVTKHEVGAIKVRSNETHIELAPDCVERFLEAIGPDRMIEETITVKALKGAPQERSDSRGKAYSKKKRPNTSRNNDARASSGPKRKYAKKADARATIESKGKGVRKPDAPAREENLPDRPSKKPKRKKSQKPKFGARFAPKTGSGKTPKSTRKSSPGSTRDRMPETPGSAPLRRKKSPKKAD
jgi:ATP-dependent RNA helicase DeaD